MSPLRGHALLPGPFGTLAEVVPFAVRQWRHLASTDLSACKAARLQGPEPLLRNASSKLSSFVIYKRVKHAKPERASMHPFS